MKKQTLPGKSLPKNIYIEIIAALLIIFFAHSSISIAVYPGFPSLSNCFAFYTKVPSLWSSILLGAEFSITLLLFFPLTRAWGFAASMLFAISIAYLCWAYPHYPHNYGGLFSKMTHFQRWLLLVSIFCTSLIAFIILTFANPVKKSKKEKQNVMYA